MKELFNKSLHNSSENKDFEEDNGCSHEGTFRDVVANKFNTEFDKFNHTIKPRIEFLEGNENDKD